MIKFLAKIAAQKALSATPGGARAWTWLQDYVTRSTAPTPGAVQQKADVALSYVDLLSSLNGGNEQLRGPHVDLGAGWHLTIPLVFWRLGSEEQHLIDIARHARADLVFPVVSMVDAMDLGERDGRHLPPPDCVGLDAYISRIGLTYHAPVRGRWPLPNGSAALVTSTQTLYYPPCAVVRDLFGEAVRVLRRGGRFIATIHLYDPYSNVDRSLSRFNYLRYSERTWNRWFNSELMTYNRLRASDYAALFHGLPFEADIWKVDGGTPEDLQELDRITVSPDFARYDRRDLSSTHLTFVMRRT